MPNAVTRRTGPRVLARLWRLPPEGPFCTRYIGSGSPSLANAERVGATAETNPRWVHPLHGDPCRRSYQEGTLDGRVEPEQAVRRLEVPVCVSQPFSRYIRS